MNLGDHVVSQHLKVGVLDPGFVLHHILGEEEVGGGGGGESYF